MNRERSKPVVIDLDSAPAQDHTPASAPPVPDLDQPRHTPAAEVGLRFAASRRSTVSRVFWWALGALLTFMIGVFVWDFVETLVSRNVWLGRVALGLLALVVGALLVMAGRELATLSRLRRIDGLRAEAEHLVQEGTLAEVHSYQDKLESLYRGRVELRWGLARLAEQRNDILDADSALAQSESLLLRPLDDLARKQIETAARQVATATAVVPLAFADVIVALSANLRMIRRIAQIYGGRSGTLGSWRLTKAVAAHLVATGAVAIGDDLIGSVAGGGVLSKVSRRFGEGVINGALTARVGVAAIEVCRPMPFQVEPKPRVTNIIKRSLTGLFGN
ncbi:MAG: TIGR01620 family protein [Rhodobacteraceae bacterium]|nr:TIGR01620 family protein [Paracoccaceae bacterium]